MRAALLIGTIILAAEADAWIDALGFAQDTEVTTAVSTHAGAADPHTGYQKESERAVASGYPSLDSNTRVPVAQLGSGTADATKFLRGDQTWAAPTAAAAWGSITGTLSAQTDLQTALDAKEASGAFSGVGACAANQWASTLNDGASATCTQPGFSNLSGAATDAQIPNTITVEAFPVGAVFISISSTNPGTSLGYGTWVAFGAGRVLVGLDAAQTEFDVVEETGGAKTHTLTTAEMPAHGHTQDAHGHTQDAHNHTQNAHSHAVTSVGSAATGSTTNLTGASDTSSTNATAANATATNIAATATNQTTVATNQNTGGGGAHANLQPYLSGCTMAAGAGATTSWPVCPLDAANTDCGYWSWGVPYDYDGASDLKLNVFGVMTADQAGGADQIVTTLAIACGDGTQSGANDYTSGVVTTVFVNINTDDISSLATTLTKAQWGITEASGEGNTRCAIKFCRDGGNAADTYTGNFELSNAVVSYTSTQ